MVRRFRAVKFGLIALSVIVVAGCSGGSGSGAGASAPIAASQAAVTPPSDGPSPDAVLAAAGTKLSSTTASYKTHLIAKISVGTLAFTYDIQMSVAGDNFDARMDMGSGGMAVKMAVVGVDGMGYVQTSAGAAWIKTDISSVDSMASAWLALTDAKYYVFDTVEGNGANLRYRFHNKGPIPQQPQSNAMVTWGTVNITSCTLILQPDGTPLSLEASETGDATMSGKSVSVSGTMSYTFSNVGDPIVITAPV